MEDAWKEALALMRTALELLDETDAPLHIGAQLEFTISRLEDTIGEEGARSYSSHLA